MAEEDPGCERRLHAGVYQEAEGCRGTGGGGRAGGSRPCEAGACWRRRHADHRRRLSGIQGVPGRLLDRRRRERGTGASNRCRCLQGAGPGGHAAGRLDDRSSVDRGPPGHGQSQGHGVSAPLEQVERLLRELAPRALASLMRRCDDFAAAEDAVQEAVIAAAAQWTRDGLPDTPCAWLVRVAQRRLTDQLRSEIARRRREAAVAAERSRTTSCGVDDEIGSDPDDALALLFMCCHPALSTASAIALTLRAVGGLTTAEIAKAFLVPESTIGQRISRAKQTIKASGVPFSMPDAEERAQRLDSVLHVLYLIFNEGYTASSGTALQRSDLSSEAMRLTREVHRLLPEDGEVAGLLALMLLTEARRAARSGPQGELIPLDEQDRSLWDAQAIAAGVALASAALSKGS